MLKSKTVGVIVIMATIFLSLPVSAAQDVGSRYFIKSTSAFWKNSLGVRHNFENGFTADLSGIQFRLAKIFGLQVELVKSLSILLPVSQIELDLDTKSSSGKKDRVIPSDQLPWGVGLVYDSQAISSTSGGEGINIAVLDTGVFKNHSDLEEIVSECKDFTARLSLIDGKCEDKNGHGTHVAGIIGANAGADKLGIYGIASEANIFAYKVCSNDGSCWADDVAAGIRDAVNSGANIINLSLGSDSDVEMIRSAIDYAESKNVLIVAAAGNDGPYVGSIDYPSAQVNVIAVGAIDSLEAIPNWSSRGSNTDTKLGVIEEKDIEFGAPGVNIESTWKNGGYAILSGTSMAAPFVSGLAAKFWQGDAKQTRDYLYTIIKDLGSTGEDNATGFGLPMVMEK